MSKQSLAYWNGSEAGDRVLVGFTAHDDVNKGAYIDRNGQPWWYNADLQGAESNLYTDAIPVADVQRRLFAWEPLEAPVYVGVPADLLTADAIAEDGQAVRYVAQPERKAIIASDTHEVLGMFKDGYQPHPYHTWLLGNVANLLGGELGIGSAGFPVRDRAQAWVQVRTPKWVTTPEGVTFNPWILARTSLNGSLATGYGTAATLACCDNSLTQALTEGATFKIRHTRYSNLRIKDAQQALGLIAETADSVADSISRLCQWEVTDRMFDDLLKKLIEPGDSQRSQTMAANKAAAIKSLYKHDDRAATWNGTAFGVLQAFDTYERHMAIVRGVSRPERQISGVIDGSYDKVDQQVLKVLATV